MTEELAYQLALAWVKSGQSVPFERFLTTPEADAVRRVYA